jgi:hypothetical protein
MQGPALTSTTYAPADQGAHLPSPAAWLRRRAAAWLAPRQTVSVWIVGYASAGLVTLLLVDGAIILTTVTSAIRVAVQTASLTDAWAGLGSGRQSAVVMLSIALGVIGTVTLIFFSVFIGLSTHNAARLGVGATALTPGQATTCWWKTVWAQAKLAAGFLVPAALLLSGYSLPGLIAALIAVEWAQRSLKDPFGWVSHPADHLAGLYGRMGMSGSDGSLLGSIWKACFVVANWLAVVAYAVPVIAVAAVVAAGFAGRSDLVTLKAGGFDPVQLAFMIVGLPLLLTASASLALLVPISIDLVHRQKTRGTMVRVGRPRSWVEPPGSHSGYARGSAAPYGAPPEPEPDHGYGRPFSGYDDQLLGSQERGSQEGDDQGRGYETRERGGYDDRGFGTGDEGRGRDDRGYETRR